MQTTQHKNTLEFAKEQDQNDPLRRFRSQFHIPKDKNGIPKAPQKKNKDGTAKNALDVADNIMGSVVKRV